MFGEFFMRKVSFLLAIIILFSVFGCKPSEEARPNISVSIYPIYDIVKHLSGGEVEVNLIVPPGASPHTFELSPKVMRKIHSSFAVVYVGLSLEAFIDKLKTQYIDKKFLVLSDYVKKYKYKGLMLEANEGHHGEGENNHSHSHDGLGEHHQREAGHHHSHTHTHFHPHSHNGHDPHIWLDPHNVIKVLPKIKELLVAALPSKKEKFEALAKAYKKKLLALDNYIKEKVLTFKTRKIVTFHGAYLYFAKRYNIEIAAVFEPFAGRSPSIEYRKKLINTIKKQNIKAVFYEPQFNSAEIKAIANEAGAKTGMLDPLGSEAFSDRTTYIDLMKFNINAMEKLLR